MKVFAIVAILAITCLAPSPVAAYVGPGAGLSLLGAVWGMVVALGTAVLFAVAWPVRRYLRARREQRAGGQGASASAPEHAGPHPAPEA
jgi:hypothetical protein